MIKINEMLRDVIRKYEENYEVKAKELLTINKKYNYLLMEYQRNEERMKKSRFGAKFG